MTAYEKELSERARRAREVGLWRYALIREAADANLSGRQRGALVRQLASVEQVGPFGALVRVSRASIDRWIRAWRAGGFDALIPPPRRVAPRTDAQVLELAAALKRENPQRTAAQVAQVIRAHLGWAPSERTIQRLFVRLELSIRPDGSPPRSFGRFEARHPNDLWSADALHGPKIAGRNSYLFAIIDDHSRLLAGWRWGHSEDTLRLEAALRNAVASRGKPAVLYVDNGSAFISKQLAYACARLGIKITHSRPGRPQGRGKIERLFGTVRGQFLAELAPAGAGQAGTEVGSIEELNRLFTAWVEQVYHWRVHTETGQAPLARFGAYWAEHDGPDLPNPQLLAEAFKWVETRKVNKTCWVSMAGNLYEVEPALVGRTVELHFDPFDLTRIEVYWRGTPMGLARPHRIGRHSHPQAHPDLPPPPRPETGIDYLRLVEAGQRDRQAAGINFTALTSPGHPDGGHDKGGDRSAEHGGPDQHHRNQHGAS